jgi:hypothetical protein
MPPKTCPDCHGELAQVKLFGRSWENPLTKVAVETDLGFYTDAQGERGSFSGQFTPQGTLTAFRCQACGRIFLYGEPVKR